MGFSSWRALALPDCDGQLEAVPTDAERVELFNTMSFGTGKYRVEGSKVVHQYDSFSHQAWTGTERTAQPAISGAKMTVTSAPFKHPTTGVDAFATTTYERLE